MRKSGLEITAENVLRALKVTIAFILKFDADDGTNALQAANPDVAEPSSKEQLFCFWHWS